MARATVRRPASQYVRSMTEQQPYDVVQRNGSFELRRYPEHLVAEVTVSAAFEDAGNRAFRHLFGYISGEKIAMTAPVVQQSAEQPEAGAEDYRIAFVLPAGLTLATAPPPTDPAVRLRVVPPTTAAAIRFSGRWSESSFQKHLAELRDALAISGLVPVGTPRFARFDPPYLPAFLRRNEVLLDVEASSRSSDR
jgi:hypothetical protein